jgi:Protein of unknown function (DUF2752)
VVHCANPQKRTNAQVKEEAAVNSSQVGGARIGAGRIGAGRIEGRRTGGAPVGGGRRRAHSVPEQLGLAGLGAAAASFVYPMASHATGLGLPCLLRALTGVPCPLCGMTTAATSLAGGELRAALAANPFVLLLAAGTLGMTALLAARAAGLAPAPVPWSPAGRRRAWWVVALLAAASWAFQLHRFGWI